MTPTLDPVVVCLLGMVTVVGAILGLRLHAFLALLLAAVVVMVLTPLVGPEYRGDANLAGIGKRLGNAFGAGCASVGILIALAAVVGQCLLKSGAAERIVRSILGLFGESRAPLAFLSSGFVLAIPVFFDTVFYLLFPLVRAFARHTRGAYLLGVLCVVAGGSMAHSLVPPTPGPLFVASELGVSLGVMIPAGFFLGIITSLSGYAYAVWANRKWPLPLRALDARIADSEPVRLPPESLPSLLASVLPIVVPVVLIVASTVSQALPGDPIPDRLEPWITFFGDKNIALGAGAVLALVLLARSRAASGSDPVPEAVKEALATGGVIILITAAGSAFGQAMRDSGVALQLSAWMPQSSHYLLGIAFLLTALVRIAQGSATVAMITAVGIIEPLMAQSTLGYHPVYLALAIGCGSKPGPWMNDSGFWIVSRMAGMTEIETLRSFSVQLTLMGVVGFLVLSIAALLFPFAA